MPLAQKFLKPKRKSIFSDEYDSSFNSDYSFGSDSVRRREKVKEEARKKWQDDQIIRAENEFPELEELFKKEKKDIADNKVVINLYHNFRKQKMCYTYILTSDPRLK